MESTSFTFDGRGGVRIAGDRRGEGEPIIFLHGGGQTRHSWGGAATKLAELGYASYTLDLRGHGESEWAPDGDYQLRAFAGDVKAFCDSLDAKPVIVGASLGGLTAMMLEGNLFPGTCAGVVIVDIIPEMDTRGTDRIRDFMAEKLDEGFADLDEAADAVAAYNPNRRRPSDHEGLKKNLRLGDDGRWRWHWDPAFMGGGIGTGDQPSEIMDMSMLTDAIGAIEVPVLLVRGRMSDVVSEEGAARFRAKFPHIAVVDVGGAGHMVVGDRNDLFTAAVVDWLADH